MKEKAYYNDLVKKIREGEISAAEELINELRPTVISYIKKYCMLPEDMLSSMFQDMLQEGCAIIISSIKKFDINKNDSFAGYVLSEIRHHYLKAPRIYQPADSLNVKSADDSDAELCDMLPDTRPGPEDKAIHAYEQMRMNEDREILRRGLKELKPQERQVIDSIFYEYKSGVATAADLGLSKQRVSNLKTSSLKKLKKFFVENTTNY